MTARLLAARLALALGVLVALPTGVQAATLTFANPQGLGPTGGTAATQATKLKVRR